MIRLQSTMVHKLYWSFMPIIMTDTKVNQVLSSPYLRTTENPGIPNQLDKNKDYSIFGHMTKFDAN